MTLKVVTGLAEFNNLQYSERVGHLLEQLLDHHFSAYRQECHCDDVKWLLDVANKQTQWKAITCSIILEEQSPKPSPKFSPKPSPRHIPRSSPKSSPKFLPKGITYPRHASSQSLSQDSTACYPSRECLPMTVFRFFLSRLLLAHVAVRPKVHPPRHYNSKVGTLLTSMYK